MFRKVFKLLTHDRSLEPKPFSLCRDRWHISGVQHHSENRYALALKNCAQAIFLLYCHLYHSPLAPCFPQCGGFDIRPYRGSAQKRGRRNNPATALPPTTARPHTLGRARPPCLPLQWLQYHCWCHAISGGLHCAFTLWLPYPNPRPGPVLCMPYLAPCKLDTPSVWVAVGCRATITLYPILCTLEMHALNPESSHGSPVVEMAQFHFFSDYCLRHPNYSTRQIS